VTRPASSDHPDVWEERDVAATLSPFDMGSDSRAVELVVQPVTHALTSEGADASEDGTGRGTPLIAVPLLEVGARTGKSTNDLRAGSGIGQSGDPMYTLQAGKQHGVGLHGEISGGKDGLARTVSGNHGQPGGVLDDVTVRRLTPLECERLQGFPDEWTAPQADAPRYRQMGNAVAVPVLEWVMRRVVATDTRIKEATDGT
jgi:DNA (cytosine-5)-methyltransferase 1